MLFVVFVYATSVNSLTRSSSSWRITQPTPKLFVFKAALLQLCQGSSTMQALRGTATFSVSGAARQTRSSAAAHRLAAPQHRTRVAAAASGTAALAARASVACRLPAAAPLRAARRRVPVCEARRGGGDDDSPTVSERLVSAIPYLLPLLDGLRYSARPTSRAAQPVARQTSSLPGTSPNSQRPRLPAHTARPFLLLGVPAGGGCYPAAEAPA